MLLNLFIMTFRFWMKQSCLLPKTIAHSYPWWAIHLFIHSVFIKNLLHTRNYTRYWDYGRKQTNKKQKYMLEKIMVGSFPYFISKHQLTGSRSSGNLKKEKYKWKEPRSFCQKLTTMGEKRIFKAPKDKWYITYKRTII